MDFNIRENTTKFGPLNSIKGFCLNILKFLILIILIPILMIGSIFEKKKEKEEETNNDWNEFKTFGDLKIFRKYILEADLPDNLDYPEECVDIYLFYLRSEPRIKELEGKYFDLNEAETENGLFLISWNEEKHGMTLWYIDKNNHDLKMVRSLSNLPWNLSTENSETVKLRGEDKNNRYDFIIAEKS